MELRSTQRLLLSFFPIIFGLVLLPILLIDNGAFRFPWASAAPSPELTYAPSGSYDLSTAYLPFFDVFSQDNAPRDLVFNEDGTKMFVLGNQGDDVNEYDLSTAYNIATATYSQNYSVNTQEDTPYDLEFNDDGTKMYVVGTGSQNIREYTLTTGFDLSAVAHTDSADVSGDAGTPAGLEFTPDGSTVFIGTRSSNDIHSYPLTTPFDLSTIGSATTFDFGSGNRDSIDFNNDGTKLFAANSVTDVMEEYSLTTPYDVSTLSFVDSYDVTGEEAALEGFTFNADGTELTVVGENSDALHTYLLSTGFDLSTISDFPKYDASTESGQTRGMVFNNDGTKMFIIEQSDDEVDEYALSTAYDITTATYTRDFDVNPYESVPEGIAFNDDGTKMFITGTNGDDVEEFTLTTGFDLTAVAHSQTFDPGVESEETKGIAFNADGTKMYLADDSGEEIDGYDLSTGFDVSTASYDSSLLISGKETNVTGVAINPAGTKLFITGRSSDAIHEYALSTPFDVSSGSFTATIDTSDVANQEEDIVFNADGSMLYVSYGSGDNLIFSLALDTEEDDVMFVESATNDGSVTGSMQIFLTGDTFQDTDADDVLDVGSEVSLSNVPDGLTPSIALSGGDTVATVTLTGNATSHQNSDDVSDIQFVFDDTAFTTTAASGVTNATGPASSNIGVDFDDNTKTIGYVIDPAYSIAGPSLTDEFDISSVETGPQGFEFSPNGERLYIIGTSSDAVNEYHLTTAFDTSTASFVRSSQAGNPTLAFTDVDFNDDGTKMYVIGAAGDKINELRLLIPGNVQTALLTQSYDFTTEETTPHGMTWNNDGSKVFIVGNDSDTVHEYTLSTEYDVSTMSYVDGLNITDDDDDPRGVDFNEDGTIMFVAGNETDSILQYNLSTGFDVSTATYSTSYDVSSDDMTPTDVLFNITGTKMYMLGNDGDDVTEYDLNIASGDFTETIANNGSVGGELSVALTGETFQDTDADDVLDIGVEVTLTNVPAGLTPNMALSADDTVATLTFTGMATNHANSDDVSNIEFTFDDSAFSDGDASPVVNSEGGSNVGIDFINGDTSNDPNDSLLEGIDFILADGAACVEPGEITIEVIGGDGVTNYVVSDDPTFSGDSWKSFTPPSLQTTWTFDTVGDFSLYALFRSRTNSVSNLMEKSISVQEECEHVLDEIGISPVTGEVEEITMVEDGEVIQSPSFDSVYQVMEGKRHPFPNAVMYRTWFDDSGKIFEVTDATLAQFELGSPVVVRPESALVQFESSSEVFVVLENSEDPLRPMIRWISTAELAEHFYGPSWQEYVLQVDPAHYERFVVGDPILHLKEIKVDPTLLRTKIQLESSFPQRIRKIMLNAEDIGLVAGVQSCQTDMLFTRQLSYGSIGDEVAALQTVLQCMGHFPESVQVTGFYGPITTQAVLSYQRAYSIPPAGVVGPITRASLNAN